MSFQTVLSQNVQVNWIINKCTILNDANNLPTPYTVTEAVDASTKSNRIMKYKHTQKKSRFFFCANKRQLRPEDKFHIIQRRSVTWNTATIRYLQRASIQISIQAHIYGRTCKFLAWNPQYVRCAKCRWSNFRIIKKIKKGERKNITKVYSILVYILFHVMAAYGTCELHWYVTYEHKINITECEVSSLAYMTKLVSRTDVSNSTRVITIIIVFVPCT